MLSQQYDSVEKIEYGRWVTNEGNTSLPIYRWFPYKESFSKQLVDLILDANPHAEKIVDPFAGVGTTLLTCKERGLYSVGVEASDMCIKIAKAKLSDYSLDSIKNDLKIIKSSIKRISLDTSDVQNLQHELLRRAFNKSTLAKIMQIRRIVQSLENHDFFLVALSNASAKISFLRKDGAYLKSRKPKYVDVVNAFFHEIKRMMNDVAKANSQFWNGKCYIVKGDARKLPLRKESFDLVITSPPYLKKEEYQKVYFIERFILLNKIEEEKSKFFGYCRSKDPGDMIRSYFRDIKLFAKEIKRVLEENARAYIIISDACIEGKVVDCCERTADIFNDEGFRIRKIYIVKKRWCTRKRTIKTGVMKECILSIEKGRV